MASFSLCGLIRRGFDQTFLVRVRAIALRGDALIHPGDSMSQTCRTFQEATQTRDKLVAHLKQVVTHRGDAIVSVDSTLEM